MICKNCGNEMRPDARFCPHCGAVNGEIPGAAPYAGPEAPVGGGKKKKTGLMIGVGAAVVAVIAIAAVALSGLFANPKKQVEAAFVKSAAAYSQAAKALDLPDTARWQEEQNISQRLTLWLKSINSGLVGYDLSALSGLALGFRTDFTGADRLMSCELEVGWGEELIDLWLKAEDDELYFHSPQLTGSTHYGVNTETLGADLTKLTGDNSMEDLSFNLFDLVDTVLEKMDQEKLEQDITAANKSLWDQAEVKKAGNNKTLVIHGTSVKTTAYQVTIPEEALDRYVDDLEAALSAWNYSQLYEEMFQAMGMPREEIQDFLDQLESVDPYGALADSLHDATAEIGDLELEVCLSGGHVSALLYEGEIDGSNVALSLYLGGGEEYVDDLSLELGVDEVEMTVKSTGDHGGKSGVFTDKTTIKGDPLKMSPAMASIVSEFSYDPKGTDGNFSWKLSIPGAGSLDMAGSLTAQTDSISLDLDDVTLKVMGMEVCSLAFEYYVSCHPSTATVENPKLISQMDQMELMMAALDVQSKAEAWMGEMEELFTSRLPDELLYGMLY